MLVQRRVTVRRNGGSENCHSVSGGAAALQILPDMGLQLHMLIGVLGQVHPLGDDLLTALLQMKVFLGEDGAVGENGVGHAIPVGLGVGEAAAAQAKQKLAEAQREAKQTVEQARQQAREEARRMMAEAESKAAQLTQEELTRAAADCDALKQNARGRLERAAQLIVGRVVER